jgi:hypothetical protein
MSKLKKAINATNNKSFTENGAVTNKSTLNRVLDFFSIAGASRGRDISGPFNLALVEDNDLAIRALLNLRDAREGVGERKLFRDLFGGMIRAKHPDAARILARLPELGRWDDVIVALDIAESVGNASVLDLGIQMIKDSLDAGNGLCAKWMPRQPKPNHPDRMARILREAFGLSPKQWRKKLVGLSNTVEQAMCSGDWTSIEYSKLPSIAQKQYSKAFAKHDPTGFARFKAALVKGEAKINASAIFPHDVIVGLRQGDSTIAEAQWKALPNYEALASGRILSIVDVSGSMASMISKSVMAMDVAVALGLYISERAVGPFRDCFITFHTSPKLIELNGKTLKQRDQEMRNAPWGGSTDFQKSLDLILNAAVKHKVPQNEMPTHLVCVSDMEFNSAGGYGSGTNLEVAREKFKRAGYEMPTIVFWNVCARNPSNKPAMENDKGVVLVSGFSPAALKAVTTGMNTTPYEAMLEVLNSPRYNF